MSIRGRFLAVLGMASLVALGSGASARAEDDFCRWGGDNGQSLKCFDCMRLVRVGYDWRWVDTCKTPRPTIFFGYGSD
jgi:hypothetical protein